MRKSITRSIEHNRNLRIESIGHPHVRLLLCVCLRVQCKKYRSQFTEEKKAVYEEKLEASEIFKDKKALYPSR